MFALDAPKVANAAADVNADIHGVLTGNLQAAVGERLVRSGDRVLSKRAHLARFFFLDILKWIEIFDFTSEADGKIGRIELRDLPSATPACH